MAVSACRSPKRQDRTIEKKTLRGKHDTVAGCGQQVRNVARRLETTKLQEALVLAHGLANELSAARLTLRPDDNGLQTDIRAWRRICFAKGCIPASPGWPDRRGRLLSMHPAERLVLPQRRE